MDDYNPCVNGPIQSVYRCVHCDGQDGIISLMPIPVGDGVCADKKCYDRNQMALALVHNPQIPHNRRDLTSAQFSAQQVNAAAAGECAPPVPVPPPPVPVPPPMPLFNIGDRVKSYKHPEDVSDDYNYNLGTIKEIGSGNRAGRVRIEIDDYPEIKKWLAVKLVVPLPPAQEDVMVVTGDDIGDVIGGDDVVVPPVPAPPMPLFNIGDRVKSYTTPRDVSDDYNYNLGTIKEIGSGNRAGRVRIEIDDYPEIKKWLAVKLVVPLPPAQEDVMVVTEDDIGDVIGGDDVVVNVGGRKRKSRKRRKKRRKSRKRRKTKKKRRKRKSRKRRKKRRKSRKRRKTKKKRRKRKRKTKRRRKN